MGVGGKSGGSRDSCRSQSGWGLGPLLKSSGQESRRPVLQMILSPAYQPAWTEAERGMSPDRISYPPPPEDSMETEICPGHRVVCHLWRRGYQGANINPADIPQVYPFLGSGSSLQVTELLPPSESVPGQGWNGTAALRWQKAAKELLLWLSGKKKWVSMSLPRYFRS